MPELTASPLTPQMRPVPGRLLDFARWYFRDGIKLVPPQDGLLFDHRGVTSIVVYRESPYQVELITFAPGANAPEHRHDHVDSLEVMVSGSLELTVEGRKCLYARQPRANGMSRDVLKFVPIPSDAYHSGRSVGGGCFLSVQLWKGMAPSHVGQDWQEPETQTTGDQP